MSVHARTPSSAHAHHLVGACISSLVWSSYQEARRGMHRPASSLSHRRAGSSAAATAIRAPSPRSHAPFQNKRHWPTGVHADVRQLCYERRRAAAKLCYELRLRSAGRSCERACRASSLASRSSMHLARDAHARTDIGGRGGDACAQAASRLSMHSTTQPLNHLTCSPLDARSEQPLYRQAAPLAHTSSARHQGSSTRHQGSSGVVRAHLASSICMSEWLRSSCTLSLRNRSAATGGSSSHTWLG